MNIVAGFTGRGGASLYSGNFYDVTTQPNGGATTANKVLIGSTQLVTGNAFSLSNNNITIKNSGVYFINAAFQVSFTGGASNYGVTVWYTINDNIVPNSAYTFTTTSTQNAQTLATVVDTNTFTAGQYINFYWAAQATGMRLISTAAGTNPTTPVSPSVNISIFNIG
jgi:hypothetical protein